MTEVLLVTHRLGQNSTPGCDQNKANFNTDARNNAASRGSHRALAIPQSFLHTPSDANPACDDPLVLYLEKGTVHERWEVGYQLRAKMFCIVILAAASNY